MKSHNFVYRSLFVLLFIGYTLGISAVTSAYYSNLDGKSGTTLFSALTTVSATGYSSHSYDDLWTYFGTTDLNSSGKIWDMYSNCTFTLSTNQCGTYSNECDCYNREHSLPKSWFGGSTSNAPGNDLFHLVPTDGKVNGYRSNYPFGEVSAPTYTSGNGSKLGPNDPAKVPGYTDVVFEPVDEYKGDFARGYLAMVVRYAGSFAFTTGEGASIFNTSFTSAGGYGLTTYGINLLMKWHRQDPVSQKEIDRNNGIQATQGNRNPFIDYPCLAEYLWGTKKDETVTLTNLVGSFEAAFTVGGCDGCTVSTDPTLTSPSASTLSFTAVPSGTNTQTITVKGINLTQTINLALSGTNAALFGISANSATSAEGLAGKSITITYSPTAEGSHTATLTISSSEFTSVILTLNGTCSNTIVAPSITSPVYSEGSAGGNITSFGGAASLTENGIYYSTTNGFADGSGTKITATTATTTGTFSVDVSTLPVGTYYFKAFARNSAGVTYSAQETFTITGASQAPAGTPTVLMGQPVTNALTCTSTKTLLIRISNLATNVNISSNNTGIVTVSPTSISPEDAATGVTLTVTKVGNGNATITISGGVVNQTINVTCQ